MNPYQKNKAIFGEDHADPSHTEAGYTEEETQFIDQTIAELVLDGISPVDLLTPVDLRRAYRNRIRTCAVDVVSDPGVSEAVSLFNLKGPALLHIKPPNTPCFIGLTGTLVACLRVGQLLALHPAGSCPHWPAIQVEYDQSLVPGQAKTENAAEDRNKT